MHLTLLNLQVLQAFRGIAEPTRHRVCTWRKGEKEPRWRPISYTIHLCNRYLLREKAAV
ncbi:hypothetical protein BX600DRAFT_454996 [Xylariales sp. PMI_506]|nr:hypothetical protein BX600DRAFT_454996 [Xylariales sp. PMI_506]